MSTGTTTNSTTSQHYDWYEIIDPKSRRRMYVNLTSGKMTWTPPDGAAVKIADERQWWELFDEKTQRYYYFNAITEITDWRKPTENCDIIPLAKLQRMRQNTEVRQKSTRSTNSAGSPSRTGLDWTGGHGANPKAVCSSHSSDSVQEPFSSASVSSTHSPSTNSPSTNSPSAPAVDRRRLTSAGDSSLSCRSRLQRNLSPAEATSFMELQPRAHQSRLFNSPSRLQRSNTTTVAPGAGAGSVGAEFSTFQQQLVRPQKQRTSVSEAFYSPPLGPSPTVPSLPTDEPRLRTASPGSNSAASGPLVASPLPARAPSSAGASQIDSPVEAGGSASHSGPLSDRPQRRFPRTNPQYFRPSTNSPSEPANVCRGPPAKADVVRPKPLSPTAATATPGHGVVATTVLVADQLGLGVAASRYVDNLIYEDMYKVGAYSAADDQAAHLRPSAVANQPADCRPAPPTKASAHVVSDDSATSDDEDEDEDVGSSGADDAASSGADEARSDNSMSSASSGGHYLQAADGDDDRRIIERNVAETVDSREVDSGILQDQSLKSRTSISKNSPAGSTCLAPAKESTRLKGQSRLHNGSRTYSQEALTTTSSSQSPPVLSTFSAATSKALVVTASGGKKIETLPRNYGGLHGSSHPRKALLDQQDSASCGTAAGASSAAPGNSGASAVSGSVRARKRLPNSIETSIDDPPLAVVTGHHAGFQNSSNVASSFQQKPVPVPVVPVPAVPVPVAMSVVPAAGAEPQKTTIKSAFRITSSAATAYTKSQQDDMGGDGDVEDNSVEDSCSSSNSDSDSATEGELDVALDGQTERRPRAGGQPSAGGHQLSPGQLSPDQLSPDQLSPDQLSVNDLYEPALVENGAGLGSAGCAGVQRQYSDERQSGSSTPTTERQSLARARIVGGPVDEMSASQSTVMSTSVASSMASSADDETCCEDDDDGALQAGANAAQSQAAYRPTMSPGANSNGRPTSMLLLAGVGVVGAANQDPVGLVVGGPMGGPVAAAVPASFQHPFAGADYQPVGPQHPAVGGPHEYTQLAHLRAMAAGSVQPTSVGQASSMNPMGSLQRQAGGSVSHRLAGFLPGSVSSSQLALSGPMAAGANVKRQQSELPASAVASKIELNPQKTGLFRRKTADLHSVLVWSKDPIRKPMIKSTPADQKKDAIEVFKLIQIYMGDRTPAKSTGLASFDLGRLCEQIVLKGFTQVGLRDEIFVQVIKQTTRNHKQGSLQRGWEIMATCLNFFPPSPDFLPFLDAHLVSRRDGSYDTPMVAVSRFAQVSHQRLERIARSGALTKRPDIVEIEHAKRSILTRSFFGATLDQVMDWQRAKFIQMKVAVQPGVPAPTERQLPWILIFLSEEVLRLNGPQTEGIFRITADAEEVNSLRQRVDKMEPAFVGGVHSSEPMGDSWSMSDPHVPATLLKQWLRELLDPLVPVALYDRCIEICERPADCAQMVNEMAALNRLVVCYLVRFLQVFAAPDNSCLSKMNTDNLAMMFAPNMLRCPLDSAEQILLNSRKEAAFVRNLIATLDTSFMEGIV